MTEIVYEQEEWGRAMRPPGKLRDGLVHLISRLPESSVVIEIGAYAGESAVLFLESGRVRHVHCIDAWTDGYDPNDIAARRGNLAEIEKIFDRRMRPYGERFSKLKMLSDAAAGLFADGFCDCVYIDGDHRYESVKLDIQLYKPKVRWGGFIAGHDWDFDGVKKAVRETLGEPTELFEDDSWVVCAA